ncbi:MAG: bifunctional D-glycero-beta-D-manno-heptose-7-phosphate kinase/D-glycero-beta-D-manno-heptose 1-phosphate adenylyltransferase HldE [Proteobacteria bacterium]|nr:bifunctional D-glycero-beta-D-manno-heptose-7-phosphate kinase/D-glycero-beta-D-manno-heptose 1-phosphate adenylyltransferase HldE [Pseudomonadota bacterium]
MSFDISLFNRVNILVVGDVMLDRYLWGDARRISPEAPVPVVNITERSEVLGGAGNVAANLSGLGCQTLVIGICGQDENGGKLAQIFKNKGIRTCLVLDDTRQTITKTRVMAKNQQLFRLDEEDITILPPATEKELLSAVKTHIKDYHAVIISDYGKGIFQTPFVCRKMIELCRERNIPVFVDPKGKDWERYEGASCVTPNLSELSLIRASDISSDTAKIEKAAQEICETYCFDNLLVTMGAKGMCFVENKKPPLIITARAKEVFDVSGAGDTVIATLAAGVSAGLSFRSAASLANTAAGVVVGKIGTQPIIRSELASALRQTDAENGLNASGKTAAMDAAILQVQAWRAKGEKIVFTNGCYDLLHPGHIDLLHKSRALGDRLVVGLNTDASVRRLKGEKRPILNENDRSAILSALSCVDLVVLFDEDTPLRLIKALRPDILVKGADYRLEDVVGRDVVESYGGKVMLVTLLEGYSTTGIVNRLLSAYDKKTSDTAS